MNLFRSEEHVCHWAKFDPTSAAGIKPIADIAAVFSLPLFRNWAAPDYVLRIGEWAPEAEAALASLGGSSSY